jgi:hypothetical protein
VLTGYSRTFQCSIPVVITSKKWTGLKGLSKDKVTETYSASLISLPHGFLVRLDHPICLGNFCGAGPTCPEREYYWHGQQLFTLEKEHQHLLSTPKDYSAWFWAYPDLKVEWSENKLVLTGLR